MLRDPIACKPAVMAETDDYVAFGSEYRALASLPGIEKAKRLGARRRPPSISGNGIDADHRSGGHDTPRVQSDAARSWGGDQRHLFPRGQSARPPCHRRRRRCARHHRDRRQCRLLLRRHEQARQHHHQWHGRRRRRREHDVGPRARQRRCLGFGRRDRLRRSARDRRQCLEPLRHLGPRHRHRGQGLGRAYVGLHGAGRNPRGARRRRRRARRLALRGAPLRARQGEQPRLRLHREAAARRAQEDARQAASTRPAWTARSIRRSSAATARRASSITSTWTIWGPIDGRRKPLGPHAAALFGDLRRAFDRGDSPRRRDRHLRHSRLRRQAQGPAFRRSAVSRRLDQPLSARRLSREMRDRRDARHALRQEADPSQDSRSPSPA